MTRLALAKGNLSKLVSVALFGLVAAAGVLAQPRTPAHLSGLINDYTPSTVSGGPYEMHGQWSLDLREERGTADFSAVMTMETSDYGILETIVDPNNPGTRSAHTHHITMVDAAVTYDMSVCPTNNPATTSSGMVVTGTVSITGNGSPAPFEAKGPSTLQVCITGGSEVQFSNVTLVLSGPATGHFGTQPIHGVIRKSKKSEDNERDSRHFDRDHSHF